MTLSSTAVLSPDCIQKHKNNHLSVQLHFELQIKCNYFSGSSQAPGSPLGTCWLQQLQVPHLHSATFQRRKGVSPLITLLSWRTNLLCPLPPSPPHTLLVHIHRSELAPDKVNRNGVVGISQGFAKCSLRLAVAASLGHLEHHIRNEILGLYLGCAEPEALGVEPGDGARIWFYAAGHGSLHVPRHTAYWDSKNLMWRRVQACMPFQSFPLGLTVRVSVRQWFAGFGI